jgi:hypothetical protein
MLQLGAGHFQRVIVMVAELGHPSGVYVEPDGREVFAERSRERQADITQANHRDTGPIQAGRQRIHRWRIHRKADLPSGRLGFCMAVLYGNAEEWPLRSAGGHTSDLSKSRG